MICDACHRPIGPHDERVGLLRAGALLAFHARCFGWWSSQAAQVERVLAEAERVVADRPPAA